MSHPLIPAVAQGAECILKLVEAEIESARHTQAPDAVLAFEGTMFPLPLADALLGREKVVSGQALELLSEIRSVAEGTHSRLRSDALGGTINRGLASALALELLKAVQKRPEGPGWVGFIPDTVLRALGLLLVDGRMPGVVVLIGKAPDAPTAENIVRDLQGRNILTIIVGDERGESVLPQLEARGVKVGLETYVVPVGPDISAAVHALSFAIRAALTFGGIPVGAADRALSYCRERVPAACLVLGPIGPLAAAAGAAAIAMGFPVITDQPLEPIGKTETTRFETLVAEPDHGKIVGRCLEARGIKVKVSKIEIPVHHGAAFEGERIRKEDMHVQFGGKYSVGFEWATSVGMADIQDGQISVIGPDIDQVEDGGTMPLGIVVKVAGRSMQTVFEPVVERHFHSFLNQAMGVFHMGQRNLLWMRISKEAFASGFRLRHLGVLLHAKIHETFTRIVDKVVVEIYTRQEDIDRLLLQASAVYRQREERVANLTDEAVEEFYSCALCQSFAPNHVCIVKPERPGLCGAYTWLDAKAAHEIDNTGPNQPVKKGEVLNATRGEWKGVNDFVRRASNQTVERFEAYSIMEFPETSCGCFECIIAIVPEANGFLVVNREYQGLTPVGMTFSTLAGAVGGGNQSPGFMGVGRKYVVSRKFIPADGGLKRVVWMPSELREALREELCVRAGEAGVPDLLDMIADENVSVDSDGLLQHLATVGHPALTMPSLL